MNFHGGSEAGPKPLESFDAHKIRRHMVVPASFLDLFVDSGGPVTPYPQLTGNSGSPEYLFEFVFESKKKCLKKVLNIKLFQHTVIKFSKIDSNFKKL